MDLGISGKTVLVTGSSRGTGEAIAHGFAAEGAHVLVHGLALDDAEPVAAAIAEAGGKATAIGGDITTESGSETAADDALAAAEGRIDILVNNYGTGERGFWFDAKTGSDAWIDVYQKNVLSAMRMIRKLTPQMKARGWGRIVQLGTIGSTMPNARMPHYYASKGALANMTVSLMLELAETGITVNTVSPGLIKTREVEAMYRKQAAERGWGDDWSEIERHVMHEFMGNPTGRIALTSEVADLVIFLASDRAAMINGTNIRIDGGGARMVS